MGDLPAPAVDQLAGGRARKERMKQEVLDALFGAEPQRAIGRYRLERLLGSGAMGLVYLARDEQLDRSVAIKLLTKDAAGLGEEPSERGRMIARVLREAQAMASLSHPNVVQVFDVGFSDDTPYIVMEYIAGPTLSKWMRAETRRVEDILRIFVEAGRGLAAAHALGIVHRDFKPANVLLDPDGHARVTDFGLARTAAEPNSAEASSPSGPLDASLTASGMVIGTPAYMAPEQHAGKAVGAAADQYAFCVALFEALYGRRPFDAASYRALVAQKRSGVVVRTASDPPIRADIDRAIERGLAPDPEDRWPTIETLLYALQPRRPRRRAAFLASGAVVGSVIVGVAALGGASSPSPCAELEASTIAWSASMPIRAQLDAEAWTRLDGAVTQAIDRWRATVDEVCASAALDVQVACLTQHREHVASTIDAMNTIEAVGRQAIVVASSLPSARQCVDVDPETEPDPPAPEIVARARELEDDLVRARAQTIAMNSEADLARAREFVERARELGYAPILAAALQRRSACESGMGDVAAAVASAEEAYFLALRANALREALRAAIALTNLVGAHAQDPEGARTWQNHATALLQRVHDPSHEAALQRSVGHVAWEAGRFAEAKVDYERALAILRTDPTSSVMEQAQLLHNIGDAEDKLGNAAAARAKFREVMAIEAQLLGDDHVQVAATEGGIALSYLGEGRYDEAAAILERTVAAHERAFGEHHPEVAKWSANLGAAQIRTGRHEDARRNLRRAISIFEEHDHRDLPMYRMNLAAVENALGHRDEARSLIEAAVAELEREHASDVSVAMALDNLAVVESDSGNFEAAVRNHERALALKIAALGNHLSVANTHNNVALALIELGRYPEAREHLRAALDIVTSGLAVPAEHEPRMRRLLADVAVREGDEAFAREQLDTASRLAEACAGPPCEREREKVEELRRRLAARR